MSRPLAIINPGHFVSLDPGACANNLREADITLELANQIVALAPSYGFDTVIAYANELSEICDQANKYPDAALFLSLHVNAGGGTGYEDYVCSATSTEADRLRGLLRIEVMNYLREQGFGDRGKKYSGFYVLKHTSMPAVLCENLFIDTARDAAKLADPAFISGLAVAYVKGIARALGTGYTGTQTKEGGNAVPEQWKLDIVDEAKNVGLITEDHNPDETATKWFVLRIALNLLKLFNVRK